MSTVKLEVMKQHGSDVVFVLPWRGKHLAIRYQAPTEWFGPFFSFREESLDDDEVKEIHEFLRNHIDISTTVTYDDGELV